MLFSNLIKKIVFCLNEKNWEKKINIFSQIKKLLNFISDINKYKNKIIIKIFPHNKEY